ncbi:MAG TPA: hypothetical protein VGD35_21080 [Chitinophaga sp.]
MKTFLLTLSGVVLVLIAAAFQQDQRKKKASQTVAGPLSTTSITQGVRIPDICVDPRKGDMHWVTVKEAVAMISEYNTNQYQGIKNNMVAKLRPSKGDAAANQFQDARFVTFPMDTIKKFIWKVEQLLALREHKDSSGRLIKPCDLGIKFYYAAYPGLMSEPDITHTKKGRHTLVLVPTYWESKLKTYVEFFPGYVNSAGRPFPFSFLASAAFQNQTQYKALAKRVPQMLWTVSSDIDAGKNEGNLCPPPDNCSADLLQMAVGL